jgi:opacity protein-like surface antigen
MGSAVAHADTDADNAKLSGLYAEVRIGREAPSVTDENNNLSNFGVFYNSKNVPGIEIGYDYAASNNFSLGVFTTLDKSSMVIYAPAGYENFNGSLNLAGGAKAGFVFGRFQIYTKAGDNYFSYNTGGNPKTANGLMYGGGINFRLVKNFYAGVEYTRGNFGTIIVEDSSGNIGTYKLNRDSVLLKIGAHF